MFQLTFFTGLITVIDIGSWTTNGGQNFAVYTVAERRQGKRKEMVYKIYFRRDWAEKYVDPDIVPGMSGVAKGYISIDKNGRTWFLGTDIYVPLNVTKGSATPVSYSDLDIGDEEALMRKEIYGDGKDDENAEAEQEAGKTPAGSGYAH